MMTQGWFTSSFWRPFISKRRPYAYLKDRTNQLMMLRGESPVSGGPRPTPARRRSAWRPGQRHTQGQGPGQHRDPGLPLLRASYSPPSPSDRQVLPLKGTVSDGLPLPTQPPQDDQGQKQSLAKWMPPASRPLSRGLPMVPSPNSTALLAQPGGLRLELPGGPEPPGPVRQWKPPHREGGSCILWGKLGPTHTLVGEATQPREVTVPSR